MEVFLGESDPLLFNLSSPLLSPCYYGVTPKLKVKLLIPSVRRKRTNNL